MRRQYVYALLTLALAAIVVAGVAYALDEHPNGPQVTASGARPGTLLTLYTHPRSVPPLHFQNAAGQALTLDHFRGRVVLVNLWATWCTPCRKEMPTLDQLQARLGGRAFQVVAISQDRLGLPAVNQFYQTVGVQHLQRYTDVNGRNLDTWEAPGIPFSMLIDRQGQAIGFAVGARDWDSQAMLAQIKRVAGLRPADDP